MVSNTAGSKRDSNVKSKVAESIRQKSSPKKERSKLLKQSQSADRQTVDEYNAIAVHLDSLVSKLVAKDLEVRSYISEEILIICQALRSKISVDIVRSGWGCLLSLLANFDKSVPTMNNKLSVSLLLATGL